MNMTHDTLTDWVTSTQTHFKSTQLKNTTTKDGFQQGINKDQLGRNISGKQHALLLSCCYFVVYKLTSGDPFHQDLEPYSSVIMQH